MSWWDFFSPSGAGKGTKDPAIGGAEGEKKINSGITGDVFNWLNRPGKSISGAVYNAGDKNNDTTFTQGFLDGLTGKAEHNWSEILGQHGVTNPIVKAVGGFAGDVILDPTTYAGLEMSKGANLTEAAANIAKSVGESGVVHSPASFSTEVAKRLAEVQANDPAHIYATFMGKKIGPKVKAPVQAGRIAKDFVIGPEENRRTLAKAFSMESEMPSGLAKMQRQISSANVNDYGVAAKGVKDIFGILTPEQGRAVSYALDNGERLDHVLTDFGDHAPIPGLETLEGYRQLARGTMDSWFNDEVKIGQRDAKEYDPTHVPRYYENPPEATPGLSRAARVRTERPELNTKRKEIDARPLQDLAEKTPYKPLTHIADILDQKAMSHFRKDGRGRMIIDAIDRFGIKRDEAGVNAQWLTDNGYQKISGLGSKSAKVFEGQDMYLPEHIIRTLNNVEEALTDSNVGGKVMRGVDNINRKFKFLNTVVSPGFHVRNSFGDAFMNVANGVVNPKAYQQAYRIIKENGQHETADWMNKMLKDGVDQGAIEPGVAAMAMAAPGKRSKINLGGQMVDSNVAWDRYVKEGSKSGYIGSNFPADPEAIGATGHTVRKQISKAAQTSGDAAAKIAHWTSNKEDFFRMANFLSSADRYAKQGVPWQDAMVKAGDDVSKFNVDYGKLSTFEKTKVKKAIPFYSWMRRNLPHQVQMMFTRPGFMASYSKGQDLLQGLLGADDGSGDKLIPEWIRNSLPVRMAMGGKESSNPLTKAIRFAAGAKGDEGVFGSVLGSMTPVGDIQQLTDPIQAFVNKGGVRNPVGATVAGGSEAFREALNMLTPVAKAPIEIGTQQSLLTGGPIKDWGGWAFGQIAPTRQASNLYGAATGDTKAQGGLASFLTGLQFRPVTEARQKGEAKRREDVIRGRGQADQFQSYLKQLRLMTGEAQPESFSAPAAPKYHRRYS